MKIVTTLNGETVCNVTSWPPKQNGAGHWELAVHGESFIFDTLDNYYYGCSFRVGGFEFYNLLFCQERKVLFRG